MIIDAVTFTKMVAQALHEDLGSPAQDLTTQLVIKTNRCTRAHLLAKSSGIVAGLEVAAEVFHQLDPQINFQRQLRDGAEIEKGTALALIEGPVKEILSGERTALNFLQQLSGVATLTNKYVRAAGPGVAILHTRKTIPGLRQLQIEAVVAGGGQRHRANLAEAILIKDNHIAAAGSITAAIQLARPAELPIEIEVETLSQLEEALTGRAEVILLDNMNPKTTASAVNITAGRALLEVSGGITLDNVAIYAQTGVDRISVGALTHSAPALDISLEVIS